MAAEGFAGVVLDGMAEAATKGTLLLVLVGIAALLLRRGSAAHRHALWAAGMVSLAVLPLVQPWMPHYGVLPATRPQRVAVGSEVVQRHGAIAGGMTDVASAEDAHTGGGPAVAVRAPDAPPARTTVQWPVVILAIWLCGVGMCLLPVLTAMWRLRRWLARNTRAAPALAPRVVVQAHIDAGMRHSVPILLSEALCMPIAVGIFHPRIVLPAAAEEWPLPRLRAVLLHELAHLRRGDLRTQMIAVFIRAAYWFHPLVWVACRRMEIEREKACDDLVLSRGIDPPTYAQTLLETATRFEGRNAMRFTAVSMARPSSLESRIRAVLRPGARRGAVTRRTLLALATSAAVMTVSLAVLSAADAPTPGGSRTPTATPAAGARMVPANAISLEGVAARARGPFWTTDGAPALPPLPQVASVSNGRILVLKLHDLPAGSSFPLVQVSARPSQQATSIPLAPDIYRILPVSDGGAWLMLDNGEKQPLAGLAPNQRNVPPTDDAGGGDMYFEVVLGSTGSEKLQFSDLAEVRLQIGIAAAPWATIAEGKESLSGKTAAGSYVTSAPTFVEPDPRNGRGGAGGGGMGGGGNGFGGRRPGFVPEATYSRITIAHDLDNVDVRVVAIDANNQEHAMVLMGKDRQGALRQLTVAFPDLAPADIKTVRLQSRPIEWTTIEHIALNPRGGSTVKNEGTPAGAAPAGPGAAADSEGIADILQRMQARRDQERAAATPAP